MHLLGLPDDADDDDDDDDGLGMLLAAVGICEPTGPLDGDDFGDGFPDEDLGIRLPIFVEPFLPCVGLA